MIKQEALDLIEEYCCELILAGCTDETLVGLRGRWPEDGSTEKAMRWLGFIQGACYGVHFNLSQLKQHSLKKTLWNDRI
jgi:hypothetical protein